MPAAKGEVEVLFAIGEEGLVLVDRLDAGKAIGCDVLVSTASNVDLDVGNHRRIERRIGPLDAGALAELIEQRSVQAVVDATWNAHRFTVGGSADTGSEKVKAD